MSLLHIQKTTMCKDAHCCPLMDEGMSGAGASASGDGASSPAAATAVQASSGSAHRRPLVTIALQPLPASMPSGSRQLSQTKALSFVRAHGSWTRTG
jgi:hypothetical protein